MTYRLRCLGSVGHGPDAIPVATATAATPATSAGRATEGAHDVAAVAGVAVAAPPHMHLERRRRQVLSELETHPEQRVAVNVVDAPLQPEPGVPVSVVIACRTTIGIVSAEMHIPREQLNVALFFQTLEGYSAEAAERGRLGLR